MPQQRDPLTCRVVNRLYPAPRDRLITPKASQSTYPPGIAQDVMYIDEVSTMNEDHAAGIVDIGFMVGNVITWMHTYAMATATYWYRQHVHWTLTSDYQVVARFRLVAEGNGNYVGDVVHLHCNGFYLEPYTSP